MANDGRLIGVNVSLTVWLSLSLSLENLGKPFALINFRQQLGRTASAFFWLGILPEEWQ